MHIKVCGWCEGSPKGTPCKIARKLNSEIDPKSKDEQGNYFQHLAECNMIVDKSCTQETKLKWSRLKV